MAIKKDAVKDRIRAVKSRSSRGGVVGLITFRWNPHEAFIETAKQ